MVFIWCFVSCNLSSLIKKKNFLLNMKLDRREKEGSKNVLISISPNSYVSLSLLNSFFIFFKVQKFESFFINELGFLLNFIFNYFNYWIHYFFMCNINILVFLWEKNIYVFLKAKTQYNYKHYFKLGCYI